MLWSSSVHIDLHLLLYLHWGFGGNLSLFLWNVSLKNCANWTFWTWFQCFEAVLYRSICTMLINLICRYLLTHEYMQIENFFCNIHVTQPGPHFKWLCHMKIVLHTLSLTVFEPWRTSLLFSVCVIGPLSVIFWGFSFYFQTGGLWPSQMSAHPLWCNT